MTVNWPNSNSEAHIIITSLSRGDIISFFPYDFEFDDSYKPEWGSYEGFGRMDPIMTYKRTTRDVTVSFNVVAENSGMALTNFANLQKLIKSLYPTYENVVEKIYSSREKKLTEDALALEERKKNAVLVAQQKQKEWDDKYGAKTTEEFLMDPALYEQALEDQDKIAMFEADASEQGQQELAQQIQTAQNQITQIKASSATLSTSAGASVIQKSPLFQIRFMNLLSSNQFVAAITNFKHKMKFDAADSSFSANGLAIPGEFNISLTFKVLHTGIPGTNFNYIK